MPAAHDENAYNEKYSPSVEARTDFQGPMTSPDDSFEAETRLKDDLELLRAERYVSNQEHDPNAARTRRRSRVIPADSFAASSIPAHNEERDSDALLYRIWIFLKRYPRGIRYVVYMLPGAILLLIPVLLGYFPWLTDERVAVGGMYLMWFGIWLEIVWCTLWITRIITAIMPSLFHGVASIFGSGSPRKWADIGERLELPTALFLWMLGQVISFLPLADHHRVPASGPDPFPFVAWIDVINKVIIALFLLATLNFAEKVCIQWIAMSFHQRTYATRIHNHKTDVGHLVQLYEFSKQRLSREDSIWDVHKSRLQGGSSSSGDGGDKTPMRVLQTGARLGWTKIAAAVHRVGNDFIGRKVDLNHPRNVVVELLRNSASAHATYSATCAR